MQKTWKKLLINAENYRCLEVCHPGTRVPLFFEHIAALAHDIITLKTKSNEIWLQKCITVRFATTLKLLFCQILNDFKNFLFFQTGLLSSLYSRFCFRAGAHPERFSIHSVNSTFSKNLKANVNEIH